MKKPHRAAGQFLIGALRKHVQAQDKFTFSPDKLKNQIKNPSGVKVAHNAIWINESGLNALTLKAKVPFAQRVFVRG